MKKILVCAITLLSLSFVSTVEAMPGAAAGAVVNANPPQIRIQIGRGHRRRWGYNRHEFGRARTTFQTRFVQRGRRTFRETYQITYWPNGRTDSTLVSRQRVG